MPARFHALITDFSFGETSPRVKSRVSGGSIFGISPADAYRSGCREVTNMLVLPQGGAYRREGFQFNRDTIDDIAAGVANGGTYRTFTLNGELADSIMLLTPGEVWLYQLPTFTVLGHAATPYTASDLLDIGIAQFEKKVVIYSLYHRPRELTFAGAPFAFTDPGTEFRAPLYAYQDEQSPPPQVSKWRLRLSFTGYTGTYVEVRVSGESTRSGAKDKPLWTFVDKNSTAATQANLLFNLQNNGACIAPAVTYIGTGIVGSTTWLDYDVEYRFRPKWGDGSGVLEVTVVGEGEQPDTLASVAPIIELVSQQEPLWSGPLLLLHGGKYWECLAPHTAAAANEPGVGASTTTYWIDRGTTVPLYVDYDVITEPWGVDQTYSRRNRGWPGHMAFHEQRLVGSGPHEALSVIAAAKLGGNNDMFNFTLGPDDNDGLLFRLASNDSATVRWFHSSDKLYIGTSSGVYVQEAAPWTPTNVHFPRINGYGSAVHIHAVEVEGELFFPTVGARQIRQISYSNELQSWQSFDLTAFAEHLFTKNKRMKQLASHQGVDTLLWCVRTDGALLALTYSPAYGALAWSKHSVCDPVLQVAPAFDGENYVTVALVNRRVFVAGIWESHPCFETLTHTSQNLFDVEPEFFDENTEQSDRCDWTTVIAEPANWSVHLDSWEEIPFSLWLQIEGIKAGKSTVVQGTELTLPARFNNRRLGIIDRGVYLGSFQAESGKVFIDALPLGPLLVGFEAAARIEPNRFESQATMTSQSMKQRWVKPVMRLLTSAMPKLNGTRPNERVQDSFYDEATGLFSGDVYVANFGSEGTLVIEPDLPLPCHLTGIFGLMTTEGG